MLTDHTLHPFKQTRFFIWIVFVIVIAIKGTLLFVLFFTTILDVVTWFAYFPTLFHNNNTILGNPSYTSLESYSHP